MMKTLTTAALLTLLTGCFQPFAMSKEGQETARAVATSMTDQAIWESMLASTDGHAINPGIELQTGMMYVARAQLVGIDADVRLAGQGHGSGVQSADAQATIRAILSDGSTLDPAVRLALEQLLGRLGSDDE